MVSDGAVDRDLQRDRDEQGERDAQDLERDDADEVPPISLGLAEHSKEQ
jgi:hypothetical protein